MTEGTFAIFTAVEIDFYARHRAENFSTKVVTLDSGIRVQLPPYNGSGFVHGVDTNTYQPWAGAPPSADERYIPLSYGGTDLIYTGHTLRVDSSSYRRVEDRSSDPCLIAPPSITESIPSVLAGMPDFAAITITLGNPSLKILFSSDFQTTNSQVRVYHVTARYTLRDPQELIWRGHITGVQFSGDTTVISARPDTKRLQRPATFGFSEERVKWRANNYEIPIVCASLIPFSTITVPQQPVRVDFYQNWLSDLKNLLPGTIPPPVDSSSSLTQIRARAIYESNLAIAKSWATLHNPTYVSFDLGDLVPSLLQMESDGTVHFTRGIFIGVEGADFQANVTNFALSAKPNILTTLRVPTDGKPLMDLTKLTSPFPQNIGGHYVHWAIYETSQKGTYDPETLPKPLFYWVVGSNQGAYPQPFDGLVSIVDNTDGFYEIFAYFHQLDRFLWPMSADPDQYTYAFWMSYLASGNMTITDQNKDLIASALQAALAPTPRCKDLYYHTAELTNYAQMSDAYAEDLRRYSAEDTILVNSAPSGAGLLRCFSANEQSRQHTTESEQGLSPHAMLIKSAYSQANLANFYDIDTTFNPSAYTGFLRSQYFLGAYHHDRRGGVKEGLKPTYFIHACLTAAGFSPAFSADGSDVTGPINDYQMQLISSTSATYLQLIRRVLPALGYLIRIDYEFGLSGKVSLVDLLSTQEPKYTLRADQIILKSVRYDAAGQRTNISFINPDMRRGTNTLDGVDDVEQQGKYFVFGDSPFLQAAPIQVEYGTWTARFQDVSEALRGRRDIYDFQIPSQVYYHGLEEGPMRINIGDYLYLISETVPTVSDKVKVQVISLARSEDYISITAASRGPVS